MANQKGIILTITLIFVIILIIIAGVSLVLMTNQARITEYQIKRIRAYYTAEAALTRILQNFRTRTTSIPTTKTTWDETTIDPQIPSLNGMQARVTLEDSAIIGPKATRLLNVTVEY